MADTRLPAWMKRYRRIVVAAGAGACALALTACGSSGNLTYADNLGPGYVKVGQLYYQVQVSRELNPFGDEDSSYLQGLTKQELVLPAADMWFGVFLQAYNTTGSPQRPASDYYITDTLGSRFRPLKNPDPNAFSFTPANIAPKGQLPAVTSLAYSGWTQGEVMLFKFPYAVYGNRPLILHIVNPANPSQQSRIELDT
ncbi:MAG TPA: hypothetical protein VHM72_09795 [Solirubrobacteraceae bacterium]|nr:hypothetical protein [Solirubrobacteraceae bacterium]